MAQIMIKCPATQQSISTGMAMDPGTFAVVTLSRNSVQCPRCGQTHTWDKKDAYLE